MDADERARREAAHDGLDDDPVKQVNFERQQHRRTLYAVRAALKRIEVRDATGRASDKLCQLCAEVPLNAHPQAWRQQCPHWELRAIVAREFPRVNRNVWRKTAAITPEVSTHAAPPPDACPAP